mmetsp:Transcript_26062/g.47279  ORF Transcript_26062/g.47279 Transcript_26062/m.47279 type:complete len:95 (-) Transcript_26062:141-425(-)
MDEGVHGAGGEAIQYYRVRVEGWEGGEDCERGGGGGAVVGGEECDKFPFLRVFGIASVPFVMGDGNAFYENDAVGCGLCNKWGYQQIIMNRLMR